MKKMSINLFEIVNGLGLPAPQGVLQVGASYGQEMKHFLDNGITSGVFIEPLKAPFDHLASMCRQLPNFVAVQALISDSSAKPETLHIASNGGMSSSILRPTKHLQLHDTVSFDSTIAIQSNTLDEVIGFLDSNGHATATSNLSLLYMDTQGAELKILMGANHTLKSMRYIFTEVSRTDLYEGMIPFLTFCTYLDAIGFSLNNVYFNQYQQGDALFIRKDLMDMKA
jgi:FkbM family methyltransferase